MLARTLSNFKGVIALACAGVTVEARILTRCCFDNLFWATRLQAKGDEFVREMALDEALSTKVRGKFILREAIKLGEQVELRSKAQLGDIGKGWPRTKSLSPKEVAEDSALRHAYLIYSQLSEDAGHPTVTSLNHYIGRFEKGGETVRVSTSPRRPRTKSLCRPLTGRATQCSASALR